ncbi:MAG: DNA polymerase Y family protein [Deferrisomatales bacterium]
MGRMACVDVPALPLQLLLGRRPEWATRPVAVVDRDRPQGVVLWANARARRSGVVPGMRYGAALSLDRGLHAAEVPAPEVEEAVAALVRRLRGFSPDVEPAAEEPGVFWLGASGLERLHGPPGAWARRVRADLGAAGFRSRLAVGWTRFGTYAAARAGPRGEVAVFRTPADEAAAARRTPLVRLGLPPALLDALDRLGVRTVGAFLALPAAGVRERFGPEAHRLHRLASGELWAPLAPAAEAEPLARKAILDGPETDVYRLLFRIKRLLDPLLRRLAERREALAGLAVRLRLDGVGGAGGERVEGIRTAAPTLDARQLLNLVHLRLEGLDLGAGVEEVEVAAEAVPAAPEQLTLFAERPRRDLGAAERALARIRAEFGAGAVVRARLREGHLPEARFAWEPLERLAPPRPGQVWMRPAVRRIYARPVPLFPRGRNEPDGWLLRGLEYGPVAECVGPYVISGGWWRRPVHREYHFARMRGGEILWIYYDRARRRWFLQGEVE